MILWTEKEGKGRIEVIYGPMFSGKTDELIRRLVTAQYQFLQKQNKKNHHVIAFKPRIDTRYSKNNIVSHRGSEIPSIAVDQKKPWGIFEQSSIASVVGIDEGQFFSAELVEVCKKLALMGKRVIVAGLHRDYKEEGFGPMPELILEAEISTSMLAHCTVCGGLANKTQRLTSEEELVVIGEQKKYAARCREHHSILIIKKK